MIIVQACFSEIFTFLNNILNSKQIATYILTVIAGLFGFIIAAIPLTIQLLEIKNNKNIDKINENKSMKTKIFDDYINVIKFSFFLTVMILIIEASSNLNILNKNNYITIIFNAIYIDLIFMFLLSLHKLIQILKEIVLIYIDNKGNYER